MSNCTHEGTLIADVDMIGRQAIIRCTNCRSTLGELNEVFSILSKAMSAAIEEANAVTEELNNEERTFYTEVVTAATRSGSLNPPNDAKKAVEEYREFFKQ